MSSHGSDLDEFPSSDAHTSFALDEKSVCVDSWVVDDDLGDERRCCPCFEGSVFLDLLPHRCLLLWFYPYACAFCCNELKRTKSTKSTLPPSSLLPPLPPNCSVKQLQGPSAASSGCAIRTDASAAESGLLTSSPKSPFLHVLTRMAAPLFLGAFVRFFAVVCWCVVPLCLQRFLSLLAPSADPAVVSELQRYQRILPAHLRPPDFSLIFRSNDWECWIWLGGLFAGHFLGMVLEQVSTNLAGQAGIRAKGVLMDLVFSRLVRMPRSILVRYSKGIVVNLVAMDCEHVRVGIESVHSVWASIPVLIVCLYYLIDILRWSVLVCLGVVVVMVILIVVVTLIAGRCAACRSAVSDRRVSLATEILSNVDILKYFTWEDHFSDRLLQRIDKEDKMTAIGLTLMSCNYALIQGIIYLSLASAFLSLYFLVGFLDPVKVFTATACFGVLGLSLSVLPKAVGYFVAMVDSSKRISDFLAATRSGEDEVGIEFGSEHAPKKKMDESSSVSADADLLSRALDDDLSSFVVRHGWFVWDRAEKDEKRREKRRKRGLPSSGSSSPDSHSDSPPEIHPAEDIEISLGEISPSSSEQTQIPKNENEKDPQDAQDQKPPPKPFLKDITLRIPKGKLTMVVGRVGSGKTSLVKALLGDMGMLHAESFLHPKDENVAYCAQKPWILGGTVRENILFGRPFDEDKIESVTRVCCLGPDLRKLIGGLDAVVAECGSNLSGGQKARLALSRACYRRDCCDIFVLDDVLGAVDPHIASRLLRDVICTYLGDRTRVLVLHQLKYLPLADFIVMMDNGRILDSGSFLELQSRGYFGDVSKEVRPPTPSPSFGPESEIVKDEERDFGYTPAENWEWLRKQLRPGLGLVPTVPLPDARKSALREYLCAHPCSPMLLVALLVLCVLGGSVVNFGSLWLSEWTAGHYTVKEGKWYLANFMYNNATMNPMEIESFIPTFVGDCPAISPLVCGSEIVDVSWSRSFGNGTIVQSGLSQNLMAGIYALLIILGLVFVFLRDCLGQLLLVALSSYIHRKAFRRVLTAPTSFFHATPIGDILSRFTADVAASLNLLPNHLLLVAQQVVVCLVFSFFVCYATSGFSTIVVIGAWVFYFLFYFLFRSSASEVERLLVDSKVPIVSHVSETFDGLTTIRAFHREPAFIARFRGFVDAHSRTQLARSSAERWVGANIAVVASTMTFFVCIVIILLTYYGPEDVWWVPDPSFMPLAVVMGFSLSIFVPSITSVAIHTEIELGSARRILDYSTGLRSESEIAQLLGKVPEQPLASWPSQGSVRFESVDVRYDPKTPLVLDQMGFDVPSRSNIGLVGRSGCGKSTCMQSLLRFVEVESGRILIDGIDISTVPLPILRSKIVIIPQDPVLFSGSIRDNLDPFGIHSDEAIWEALEESFIAGTVRQIPEQLDGLLGRTGVVFSVGEKQLLCLARAILRRPKIVLLDEINANVDLETDRLMQETIDRCFRSCTRLTIAHRVSSLMGCDKIMLLKRGLICDEASPNDLVCHPERHEAFQEFLAESDEHGVVLQKELDGIVVEDL